MGNAPNPKKLDECYPRLVYSNLEVAQGGFATKGAKPPAFK